MKIAVYCGSAAGNDPAFIKGAVSVGEWIACKGHTLIFGGGNSGLMGAVAEAAFSNGARVLAYIPSDVEFIKNRPNPYATETVYAENMSARKQAMLDNADAFIALPGGIGTIDEMSEIMTLNRIGVFDKPCVMFNQKGFYESFKKMTEDMIQAGFLSRNDLRQVLFSDDISEIQSFFG